MAKVEKDAKGGNRPPETLEERLQRIEAEAARKRKESAKAKAVEVAEKPAKAPAPKEETPVEKAEVKEKKAPARRSTKAKKVEKPVVAETAEAEATLKEEQKPTKKATTRKAPAKKTPAAKKTAAKKPVAKKTAATKVKAEPVEKVEGVKVETPVADEKPALAKPAKKTRAPRKPRATKATDKPKSDTSTTLEKEIDVKEVEAKTTKAKPKGKTPRKAATKTETAEVKTDEPKKATPAKRSSAKKTQAPAKAEKTVDNKPTPAKGAPRKANSNSKTKNPAEGNTQEKKSPAPRKKPARTAKPAAKSAAKTSNKSTKKSPTRKNPRPAPVAVPVGPESDKELIINSSPTQVEIALMENGKLVELHHQKTNNNFTVGDIFLGKIKRLMPGLNAAFVDIGHKKDAFLHYTDLGPKLRSLLKYTDFTVKGKAPSYSLDKFKLEPEIIKTGKIDQVLNKRDNILVQVLKEPIGTKGPRLSCEITIPGRFLVLTPFVDVIAVSKKIGNSEERKRLKMLIESIKPKNFGVIVRTAAEGKKVQDLHEELKLMMDKWKSIFDQLQGSQPPMKLLSELDKTSSILRDILNDSFNNIVVNDKEMYSNIKTYMGTFAPNKVGIVNMHKSRKPIFDERGVTKQIKSSFGKTATMSSGAYLVIEHTEAMHVIDVNSGHKMSSSDQESAVMSVNMESAEEIARQMRLRDIGGIIIVDFIDMRNKDNKQKLVTAMRQFMKKDRAQHTILPLSKFGLMQITRQRVRPEVKINTAEVCPSCKGSGKINPSILLTDELERDLKHILQSRPKSKLQLTCHPYIEAFLKKGIPSIQMRWYMKFYKWIKIRANADYSMTAYKFFDGNEDEIRLK
jgi:ribonuclease G